MLIDWYSATFQEKPDDLVLILKDQLGADEVERKNGAFGYTSGFNFKAGGGVVARLLAGGPNGSPNAWASGSHARKFSEVARDCFPESHHVTRIDSAQDIEEAGAWKKLKRECLCVARESNLTTQLISHPLDSSTGETLYIGSPSSQCRVRLYEKGKEMRGKFPARASEFSTDWVRLEAQLRPQDGARKLAATASAEEIWGYSLTSRKIAKRCLGISVNRVRANSHDAKDDESAKDYHAKQWGPIWERDRLKFSSRDEWASAFFRRIDRVELSKKK